MSEVFLEAGYPPEFHSGIWIIPWIVLFIESAFLGLILIRKAIKIKSIKKRQLYLGAATTIIMYGDCCFIIIQIGVYVVDFFVASLYLGTVFANLGAGAFFYYLEKNVKKLKYVPTSLFMTVAGINLVLFIMEILSGSIHVSLITATSLIGIGSMVFALILGVSFLRKTSGAMRKYAIIMLLSILFLYVGVFTDHPPLITLLIDYPLIWGIISPIAFMLAMACIFMTGIGFSEALLSFYTQEHICTIHRGNISSQEKIIYCPACKTIYCEKCFDQVVRVDGCWNCGQKATGKSESEKVLTNVTPDVIEMEEISHKNQKSKNNK